MTDLQRLDSEIIACHRCPRLVEWREKVAIEKVKRHADEEYWGKAVPNFGDPNARILIVGLAPAAHGANRTGRMFTGDRSGDWLYRALYKASFANQSQSIAMSDGLELRDVLITAVCHCAPPDNKPLPEELINCRPYLDQLLSSKQFSVVIALGKIAFDAVLRHYANLPKPKAIFEHCATTALPDNKVLIGSYHPSQQNTFTGRLTEEMLDHVFTTARQYLRA